MTPAAPVKRNSTFKGDVLRLVSGTGLAQIIALLAAPILTRLYAPEAFGVAAIFAAITGILGVLACMRYELSIVLPDNDREAANLLAVSLSFSVLMTALTVPLIWYGGPELLQWAKMPELAAYLWLVPVTVLIHGLFTALNYWNTRTKHFTRLSIARVTSALASTSGSLGAGLSEHATGGALIAASISGQAVATTVLVGQIWRDNGRFILSSITWRKMWAGIKRHRKFPLYSSWSSLLNTASWMMPVVMLGAFFSPIIVGFYALGFRVLQTPLSLVSGALSQVFFQRASVARLNGTLPSLVEELFRRLLIVGVLPCLILTFLGEDLFILIFGEDWAEAGFYTQLLAPWALIWFISSPLSTVYIVLEQQHREPVIQGTILVTRVTALAIGGYLGDPRLAVLLFSLGGIFAYGYLIKVIFDCVGLSTLHIIRKQVSTIVIGGLCTFPVALASLFDASIFYILLCAAAITLGYFTLHYGKLLSPLAS
jgi:O-antigen/teichoic acid export membrane protein